MDKSMVFEIMKKSILEGDKEKAREGAGEAIRQGINPLEAVELGLSKGMTAVGDRFERGDAFLPELILAADTFDAAMDILGPEIEKQGQEVTIAGTVAIATVKGDVHEIGKNIVAMLLRIGGFTVIDLGVDVQSMRIIEGAEKAKADVIALSSLMTTTMPYQKDVLDSLEEIGVRDRYVVIVGGGPVTQQWADEIGADGYASNAIGAVTLVKRFVVKET